MARTHRSRPHGTSRLTSGTSGLIRTGALAAIAIADAVLLGRVFAEGTVTLLLAGAGLLSLTVAAVAVRLPSPVGLAVTLLAFVLPASWILFPGTLVFGLPSPATWDAVAGSLHRATDLIITAVAPVDSLRPLVLAAAAAAWAAAPIGAAALVAGRPLLTVIPTFALLATADLSLGTPPSPTVLAITVGCILLAFGADAAARSLAGSASSSSSAEADGGGAAVRLRAITRGWAPVGAVTLAVALVAPGLLPGGGSQPLFDVSRFTGGGGGVDPFISIEAQLTTGFERTLFTVSTSGPGRRGYWRTQALERFDGTSFSAQPERVRRLEADAPERTGQRLWRQRDDALVQVLSFSDGIPPGDPIPLAYPAVWVGASMGTIDIGTATQTVTSIDGVRADSNVRAISTPSYPSPADLDRVGYDVMARAGTWLTAVPGLQTERLRAIAREWTADTTTPYRAVLAIQSRLRDGTFRYSTSVRPPRGSDAVVRFLTETRTGFCQQYATAMAALVRSLGIPARVAIGYSAGTASGRQITVTNRDAHAWVEVWFGTHGWLAFEPTPGRGLRDLGIGTYIDPAPSTSPSTPGAADAATPGADASPGPVCALGPEGRVLPESVCQREPGLGDLTPARSPGADIGASDGAATGADRPSAGASTGVPAPALAALLLGLVLAGALVASRRDPVVARGPRGTARTPRERSLAAYRRFEREARGLGYPRDAAEALDEYRRRISREVPDAADALVVIASGVERVAYGAQVDPTPALDGMQPAYRAASRALREAAGWRGRLLAPLRSLS